MKKIKIKSSDDFGSLNTKYSPDAPQVDNSEFTSGTKNIETSVKGVITKRKGGVQYSTLPTPPRDQYEAIFSDGVRHLLTVDNGTLRYSSGDGNETSVLSGLSAGLNFEFANTQDRVYFGNGIQKKVYDRSTNYGGVTYTFPSQTVKDFGVSAPLTAPSVAVAAGGSVPTGNHTYKVTFVYYDSEESNGGLASAVANATAGNQTINLTSIPVGGYGVTARKIYRDDNDGVYVFVGVLSNNTATTFSDTAAAGLTPIPTDQGNPPDFTLISLYLDRLFLAGIPGDPYFLFFSEVSMPDVYPSANTIACNQEDPITGIVKYLDRLVVFNRRSMGQIVGKTSDQFRYAEIEPSVGCVDNRSIQIRVIDGVPVLVWLSDKGFYAYNGNSVVYISNSIEDQINSNIQQAVIQKNKITNSDYTAFSNGTLSNGVNIEANPGTITNKGPYWDTGAHPLATYDDQTNPKHTFDSQSEWENGTVLTNLVTDSSSTIKAPLGYRPDVSTGNLSNAVIGLEISTNFIGLETASNVTGGDHYASAVVNIERASAPVFASKLAYKVDIPRSGNLTSVHFRFRASSSGNYVVRVWSDLGTEPGAVLFTSSSIPMVGSSIETVSLSLSQAVSGSFWFGIEDLSGVGKFQGMDKTANFNYNGNPIVSNRAFFPTLGWLVPGNGAQLSPLGSVNYTFCQNAVSRAGSWVSQVYDCLTSRALSPTLNASFSHPVTSFCSGPYSTGIDCTIEATNDPAFASGIVQEQVIGFTGSFTPSLSLYRYWRFRFSLNTTDDRVTPKVYNDLQLLFQTTATWESEVIDCTSDVTVYQALTVSQLVPSGTSVVTEISTSADNITYTPYVSFGLHSVQRYVKIKITLTADGGDLVTASVSSVAFSWSVASTFISDSIDLGVDPSGFDIFQASFTLNGGAVTFSMRSASTEVGLSSATWYTVTNGLFPTSSLPTLQWVQWRAQITSNPDQVPTIDSVTIGWFVGTDVQSIRCASIFYNKNYYVALAEFESDHNNLLYVLDYEGKWRLFRDLNIATMSFFFNNPYYGDAVTGAVVRFLEGLTDQGSSIELQVNTKAYDGSTEYSDYTDKIKVLDNLIVSVKNTGATYDVSYSVDEGQTYYQMFDTNGNNSWTTGTDGRDNWKFLRPNYETMIPVGRTIIFKFHNNDTKECEIKSWKAEAFVREQPPIITG